jgi:hypothetical protein
MNRHSTTKSTELRRRSPLTVVATHPTRSDSELSQLMLWAAGFHYEIATDAAGGVRLLVEDASAFDARSVLDWPPRNERR